MTTNRISKKDKSQPQIEKELKELGFSVSSTHEVGDGFPDIVVGILGLNTLFEIKNTVQDKLNELETKFHQSWQGQLNIAHSTEDVIHSIKSNLAWLKIRISTIEDLCDIALLKLKAKKETKDEN